MWRIYGADKGTLKELVKIANKTGITSNTKIFGCKKIFYFFLINYLQLPKPLLHLHTLTVRGKKNKFNNYEIEKSYN